MKTGNPMKRKEMNPFRILLAGLVGIGISFVVGHYASPDEKISQLALNVFSARGLFDPDYLLLFLSKK